MASIASLKEAIRLKLGDNDYHGLLGIGYNNLKRFDEAVTSLKKSIRLKPDEAWPHAHLGVTYENLQRYMDFF